MKTARVHRSGGPFQVDEIPIPEPTGSDVLIEVKACGVVPNLGNVVKHCGVDGLGGQKVEFRP